MGEEEGQTQEQQVQPTQQSTQGLINAPANVFAISNRERQRKE